MRICGRPERIKFWEGGFWRDPYGAKRLLQGAAEQLNVDFKGLKYFSLSVNERKEIEAGIPWHPRQTHQALLQSEHILTARPWP